MLKSQIILLPTLNRGGLCTMAEMVTGKNHVRATDAKNLKTEMQEYLSILEDFGGNAHDGEDLLYLGFIFSGTYPQVVRICALMNTSFLVSSHSISDLLMSAIVVGSIARWREITMAPHNYELPIAKVFEEIQNDLNKFCPPTSSKVLRLR